MVGQTITGMPKNHFEYSKIAHFYGFESKLNDEDFWKKVCEEKTTLRENQQRNSNLVF